MALEDIYYSLEDKYYDFMDGLEKQGTKVYEYFVDPIEARGIPSFPVFSVLSLLVLGALLFGAYSLVGGSIVGLQTGDTATVSVSVLAEGSSLEGVLVKLSYGDNVLLEKTADGVAVFTGIPKRTRVLLSVEQEGYSPFFRNTTTTSAANQELNLELEKKGKQEQFFLFVTDDNGNPLPGVTVYSKNPDGLIVELETDAQGKVPVPYNSPADSFNMRLRYEGYKEQTHTCFAGKGACEVSLSSDAPDPQIPDAPKASVSVEVLDQKGDPVVDARVSLGQEATGASLDGDYTDGIGKVFFPDAAAIGTSVYVVVEPLEGFETYTSDPKPAGETTDFLVLLKAKPKTGQTPDFSSIQIEVVGADKLPIEGAEVSLFFAEKPLKQITSAATDSGGMVLFEASATASVYATAYAPGYLPARTRVMKGGEATQLKLIKAVIGNYGSLKVNVINQEEVPVEMASVTIVSSDGYFLGLPRQETAADGSAAFTGLPVDATVKAIASYEADSGASDLVSITVEEKEVNVKLKPADAYVSVLAKQAGTSSALEATFTAYKFSDNSVIASCSGSKVACTLTVPAKTKLYLKAESKGFITATSEEFDVPAAQNLKKEVVLLDSSLSDELKVLDVRVVDFYGKNVSSVDKGRTYKFLLSVNLPSKAEKAGAFMLIGKGSSASDEPAVFTDYSKPSTATILKGSAYTPGQACADGMSDQGKELKWIDYSFTDFGSKTISSTVFVTPKATAQDELVLQYRLSAKKASSFLRLPEDKAFGSKEKTDDLDWCYAKTMELRIPVKEGGTTCSDSACLSALFRLNSSTSANGMMIPLNSEFTVEINLRAFSSLDSPFLKIDVDKSLEIKGYDFGSAVSASGNSLTIPLSFAGETTGSVTLKAGIPTQNAKIAFNFGDASGTLLEAQRYVVVQGTGVLSVSADPLELTANQGNSIKVTILSKEGKSIDDAKIIFKETKGAPFNGFPSGALSMLGDGTEEHGKDGSYLLSGISPTSVGAADLVVQRNGFSDVKKEITITTADALSFDQDPSLVEMSCTSRNTLSVTTPLTTKLNVRGSFSGSCASVRALGTAVSRDSGSTNLSSSASSTLSFQVKPGKDTKLLLTPTSLEGQCVMTLTSTTPAGLFASTQDVWLASSCAAPAAAPGASATPAASPTPVGPPLAAFCQPPSLAQILPKHYLSQGMNDQQGAYTALTAPVVLISDTNGLQFINNNEDECNLEGNKLSCTKKIYSLIPFNAMAFSVVNKVLTTTDIYFDKPGASCYRIEEVRSGLTNRILGGELSNQVSSLAGLVRNQYRTYVIYFTPKKECIQYAEKEGGGLKLSVKDNKAFNLRFWSKGFGGAQSQAYLTFKVDSQPHDSDKYAFMLMPTTGEITLRGAKGYYEEPAIIVNNIHADKDFTATVYGKSFSEATSTELVANVHSGQAIAATLILNSKELKIDAKASGLGATDVVLSSSATVKHVAAPEGLDAFDVVGNVDNSVSADCSGANYCTPDRATKYQEEVQGHIKSLFEDYLGTMDTLAYDNNPIMGQQAQQQVYAGAMQEYYQMMQIYQQCLQQACYQGQGTSTTGTTTRPAGCDQMYPQGAAGQYPYGQNYPYSQQYPYGQNYQYPNSYNPSYPSNPYGANPYLNAPYNDPTFQNYYANSPNFQNSFQNNYLSPLGYPNQLQSQFMNPALTQQEGAGAPIIDVKPNVFVPVKVAGADGGIFVIPFTGKASGTAAGSGEWVRLGTLRSTPYMYSSMYSGYYSGSQSSKPLATAKTGAPEKPGDFGFPYLKKTEKTIDGTKTPYYELVGWAPLAKNQQTGLAEVVPAAATAATGTASGDAESGEAAAQKRYESSMSGKTGNDFGLSLEITKTSLAGNELTVDFNVKKDGAISGLGAERDNLKHLFISASTSETILLEPPYRLSTVGFERFNFLSSDTGNSPTITQGGGYQYVLTLNPIPAGTQNIFVRVAATIVDGSASGVLQTDFIKSEVKPVAVAASSTASSTSTGASAETEADSALSIDFGGGTWSGSQADSIAFSINLPAGVTPDKVVASKSTVSIALKPSKQSKTVLHGQRQLSVFSNSPSHRSYTLNKLEETFSIKATFADGKYVFSQGSQTFEVPSGGTATIDAKVDLEFSDGKKVSGSKDAAYTLQVSS